MKPMLRDADAARKCAAILLLALLACALVPDVASAQSVPTPPTKPSPPSISDTVIDRLEAFEEQISMSGAFGALLKAIAFICGLALVAASMFKFVRLGSGNPQERVSGAIMTFVVGIILIQSWQFLQASENTRSVSSATISYGKLAGKTRLDDLLPIIFNILIPIGFISFLRGLFMLKSSADGGQQATVGMALTHVIAGVLLINAQWSVCTVANSVGFGSHCT